MHIQNISRDLRNRIYQKKKKKKKKSGRRRRRSQICRQRNMYTGIRYTVAGEATQRQTRAAVKFHMYHESILIRVSFLWLSNAALMLVCVSALLCPPATAAAAAAAARRGVFVPDCIGDPPKRGVISPLPPAPNTNPPLRPSMLLYPKHTRYQCHALYKMD
jgi:hypothetical protein